MTAANFVKNLFGGFNRKNKHKQTGYRAGTKLGEGCFAYFRELLRFGQPIRQVFKQAVAEIAHTFFNIGIDVTRLLRFCGNNAKLNAVKTVPIIDAGRIKYINRVGIQQPIITCGRGKPNCIQRSRRARNARAYVHFCVLSIAAEAAQPAHGHMAGAEDGGRVALSERGEAGQFGNQFSGDLLKRNIEFVSFARDEHGVIIACFKTSVEF